MQPKLTMPGMSAANGVVLNKIFLFILLNVFLASMTAAQKNKAADPALPSFGQVDKADLEMKECDFDDKAEALVLLDEGRLEYVRNSGLELKRRLRIKLLNNKGLDWANVHLRYGSAQGSMQFITAIEAQTYNLDGAGNVVVNKVDKKLVYDKKLNKRNSEKVFTFPEAKVGSVIEYKYTYVGAGLIDWYFQRSIPVRYSRFTLDFPSDIEVAVIPFCAGKYEKKEDESSTGTVAVYSMSQVPALRDEPFIINQDHYRDRLETKLVAYTVDGRRSSRIVNWPQVIKFLMEDEDFGVQIKRNIPRTADLDEKLKNITSLYERMKVVYKYVQDNMQWNEYNGIWALEGVKSAWKDKKGTTGEINLILVNLLKDAGLNVHPILVSTHDNGVINTINAGTYEFPGFNQFNKVMAYVELNGVPYVLDATQKNTPAHLIPSDVLLTQGLVIEKIDTYEWGWKTLWKDDATAKSVIRIKGTIDAQGKMEGEASVWSYDYARLARIGTVKGGKEKYLAKYVGEANPALQVADINFGNVESDSLPLEQTIKFTESLKSAGDYRYFSVNMLTGLEKNPFVADNRFSDVFFGNKQHYEINGTFLLPEGYQFDELPKNLKMIMPDTSISILRMSQVNGNMLQTRIQVEFKRPAFEAAEYPELQEFYQRLFEILNEQFVVRKKS